METLSSPSRSFQPWCNTQARRQAVTKREMLVYVGTQLGIPQVWTSFWKAAVSEQIHERGFGISRQSEKKKSLPARAGKVASLGKLKTFSTAGI